MVRIIAIRLVGGNQHEHISMVRWQSDTGTGDSTREGMITYINGGNKAYVTDGVNKAYVGVVNAIPPYIRTYADGKWSDNLLALPRF